MANRPPRPRGTGNSLKEAVNLPPLKVTLILNICQCKVTLRVIILLLKIEYIKKPDIQLLGFPC